MNSQAANQRLSDSIAHDEDDVEGQANDDLTTGTVETTSQKGEKIEIGNKESKHVFYTRALVIAILVSVAVAMSIVVYSYSKDAEQDSFHAYFEDVAHQIIEEFSGGARRRVSAIESLSNQITSYVLDRNDTEWPNVALPDFERRVRYTLELSEVLSIIFFPIVTSETRQSWEEFSVENQAWLQEGLDAQDIPPEEYHEDWIDILEDTWGSSRDLKIRGDIFRVNGTKTEDETGAGPYAPWWQFAPAFHTAALVNYNAFSHPTRGPPLQSVIDNKQPLVTQSWDYADESDPETVGKKAILNLFLQHGGNEEGYEVGPAADLYVPVFTDYESNEVGGELVSYVYWQVYFEDILPHHDVGVVVVLEDSCNQTYTYRIDGSKATYLGQGDQHDREYNSHGVHTPFGSFAGTSVNYESLDELPDGQCLYKLSVYPSKQLEEGHTTKEPLHFALILVGAFLFTSLAFFLYDYIVERRQKLVMNTAVKSSAVVASLFPEEVRDRLYDKDTSNKSIPGGGTKENFFAQGEPMQEPAAIADLYPECTVQFCDLVGFTKWSSTREPKDVFKLLETLYKSFDKSASRLGVFKVETIGDCYVAATGLPAPQKDHAVVMARFSADCILKTSRVTQRLAEQLGQDTADLTVRIGMHSGPVTAGVLRGAKARFQLFGDTVNTAARMESTGVPMKIHVSSSTAELIREAGHESWISQRGETIEAKGKGKLQTFWVRTLDIDRSTSSPDSEDS